KDRSAVLPAGKRPDACYWFDSRTGTFVTSTWYRDRCHSWVAAYNASGPANRWFGRNWERQRPALDYEKIAGPDEVSFEVPGVGKKMGRSFPHTMGVGKKQPDREYYDELVCSPYGNDLLTDFATTALKAMNLGRGEFSDLLSISYSSNDVVGHHFGPDSQ